VSHLTGQQLLSKEPSKSKRYGVAILIFNLCAHADGTHMVVAVLLFFPSSKNLIFKIRSGLIHFDREMRAGESLNAPGKKFVT
jgi:hypothetical protein